MVQLAGVALLVGSEVDTVNLQVGLHVGLGEVDGLLAQLTLVEDDVLRGALVPVAAEGLFPSSGHAPLVGDEAVVVVVHGNSVGLLQVVCDVVGIVHHHLLTHEAAVQVHLDHRVAKVFCVQVEGGAVLAVEVQFEVGLGREPVLAHGTLEEALVHPVLVVVVQGRQVSVYGSGGGGGRNSLRRGSGPGHLHHRGQRRCCRGRQTLFLVHVKRPVGNVALEIDFECHGVRGLQVVGDALAGPLQDAVANSAPVLALDRGDVAKLLSILRGRNPVRVLHVVEEAVV